MIGINCDMGEGIGNEAVLMPFITSANIACGQHAGDSDTMRQVVDLCLEHGVNIGAHPSYPDRENFGRTDMNLTPETIYRLVKTQIELLQQIVEEKHARLHHVKPHGALYNRAAKDAAVAHAIARAVKDCDPALELYGLSGSLLVSEAEALGLHTASEVFADRSYLPDGSLTPRTQPGALITDPAEAVKQVRQIVSRGSVTAINGTAVSIKAETVCIHGDGAHALHLAQALHHAFGGKNLSA